MLPQIILFFGPVSPFSHWHHSPFIINGGAYLCAGQYIMYRKALLFEDEAVALQMLRSGDPKRHRTLGRTVKNFDKNTWHNQCMQYSFDANYAKFSQNKTLNKILLDTGEARLAEASPYDRVWGIGLSSLHANALSPEQWRGRNLAGESLMQVRAALKK